ncbi:DUF4097 family beta strand repeat-containing protein [Pontibacillus salicampi]|uniref:DUF4097 family beta strand repeat-containing protein n=1 Tax=Pontibacillus salicampi TaxID=1449801 RepID=A0ABV6LT57_9BACI
MKKAFLIGLIVFIVGIGGVMITTVQGGSLSITSLLGATETFEQTKSYQAEEVKEVSIEASSSDVTILPSTNDKVEIRFFGKGDKKTIQSRHLETSLSNGSLDVRIEDKRNFSIGISILEHTLEVHLPEQQYESLTSHISSGDITLQDITAEDLKLDTSSGEIQLNTVKSDKMNIQTSSGSIQALEVSGDMKLHTSSGNIDVEVEAIEQDMDLSTSSGDVTITSTATPENMDLSYDSSSGEADINFPLQYNSLKDSSMQAIIGDGSHEVVVDTSSGDFTFHVQ